jgi:O-antigen ligase
VRSIEEQGSSKGTGAERIYTWGIGWHMFLDNPIIGVGQGNFPWAFKEYEFKVTGSDQPFQGRSLAGRAAHSIYFTMLPELGIIGTTIIFWIILAGMKDLKYLRKVSHDRMIKDRKREGAKYYYLALGLEGSLVAYLVSGAFISILYYPSLWILLGFIISLKKIVVSKLDNMQSLQGIA